MCRPSAQFNLRALSAGWSAAQLQASLSGSSAFTFQPSGTQKLDQNLSDLQPRNHLYLTAGATNLPLTFAFNTTTQADGFHELTAVAYEGSHVRTQKRVAQTVRIQNSSARRRRSPRWSATPTPRSKRPSNSPSSPTRTTSARSSCSAPAARSTNVLSQSNAVFSVAGTNLGLGLHPFYALVTASSGKQYRTETKWIRLVGAGLALPGFPGRSAAQARLARHRRAQLRHPERDQPRQCLPASATSPPPTRPRNGPTPTPPRHGAFIACAPRIECILRAADAEF